MTYKIKWLIQYYILYCFREKNFWIEEYAKPDQNDQYLNKLITRTLGIKLLSKYIEESRRLLVFTVQYIIKIMIYKKDLLFFPGKTIKKFILNVIFIDMGKNIQLKRIIQIIKTTNGKFHLI